MTKAWPDRFAGLATLPMQDVKAAIAELERVMTHPGFKGAMINDHVNGRTLDEPEFLPFWKAAEQLGVLILL
jgi:predicted TIM-barrel fold metal-dependent hydrolase